MPTEYIVEARRQAEQWENSYGKFQAWEVKLMDGTGSYHATTNTKVGKEFPAVGQKVEGDLTPDGPDRWKFKRASAGGGGSSSGAGGTYQRDPKESASIVRQHSQQMAIAWAVVLDKKGQLPQTPDLTWLAQLTDWFQRDAKGEPQS